MIIDWVLYSISLAFIIFATFSDLKKREVANWLNYTLIVIILLGKGFISVSENDWHIFAFTLCGLALFYGFANLLYYSRVFAGGDAKLLIGLGGVFPYSDIFTFLIYSLGFIFLLFFIGAVYTLLYSTLLIRHNWSKFTSCFMQNISKKKILILIDLAITLILLIFLFANWLTLFVIVLILILPFLYCYLKAVEESGMIILVSPGKLTEGEWLAEKVKIGKIIIEDTVHGLSKKDIALIKKAGKKVWIKQGVPFVPAFLASWIIMGFFFSIFAQELNFGLKSLFSELFDVF